MRPSLRLTFWTGVIFIATKSPGLTSPLLCLPLYAYRYTHPSPPRPSNNPPVYPHCDRFGGTAFCSAMSAPICGSDVDTNVIQSDSAARENVDCNSSINSSITSLVPSVGNSGVMTSICPGNVCRNRQPIASMGGTLHTCSHAKVHVTHRTCASNPKRRRHRRAPNSRTLRCELHLRILSCAISKSVAHNHKYSCNY